MQGRHVPFSQQEADMKWRAEEMRQHRAMQAAAEAKTKAEADTARTENEAARAAQPIDPAACTRIQIRGTADDAANEAKQARWEADVRTDAAANGGMVPPKVSGEGRHGAVRLVPAKAPPQPRDTESALNGLIAECHFLMHEIAYHAACLTYDPVDRISYLTAAQNLALTGAKVGETVAKLRTGVAVETRRHELVYTHVQASSLQTGRTLPPPALPVESDKQ